MADNDTATSTQGLTESVNPLADERLQGVPSPQAQERQGTEEAMQPPADNGEASGHRTAERLRVALASSPIVVLEQYR
jgi:hypothetical protein